MFKLDPKWLVIGILIAGLFGYWHWTTSQLDHYKTLSERQEQTIAQQKNEIAQLKVDIAKKEQQILIERESVKKQTALEQQEKDKTNDDVKIITKVIYKDRTGEQSEFTGTTYGEAITFLRIVMNERDICASRIKGIIDWEATTKNKP